MGSFARCSVNPALFTCVLTVVFSDVDHIVPFFFFLIQLKMSWVFSPKWGLAKIQFGCCLMGVMSSSISLQPTDGGAQMIAMRRAQQPFFF